MLALSLIALSIARPFDDAQTIKQPVMLNPDSDLSCSERHQQSLWDAGYIFVGDQQVKGANPMFVIKQRFVFRGKVGTLILFDYNHDGLVDAGWLARDDSIDDSSTPSFSANPRIESFPSASIWQRWYGAALRKINRICAN